MMEDEILYHRSDAPHESIVTFVEKNKDNAKIKDLYESWESVCMGLQINITYVRWKLDLWFQNCYLSWKELQQLSSEVSHEMAQEMKEKLFKEFILQMEAKAAEEKNDFINSLKIGEAKNEIVKNYQHCQEEFIDKAVACVEKENHLIADFKKVKQEAEKVEANLKMDEKIFKAKIIETEINKQLDRMNNELTNWNRYFKTKEDCQSNLSKLQDVLQKSAKNGVVAEEKKLLSKIEDCSVNMDKCQQQITMYHKDIMNELNDLVDFMNDLVTELVNEVEIWKKEFKFQFVELFATPNLSTLAPWCAQTGRLIYDIIHGILVTWGNILNCIESEQTEDQEYKQAFVHLLAYFIQRTFLVTEQESCIIKVDKKHLPKCVVRILAAENFPERSESITASFAFEDDINLCCHDNNLDLEALQQKVVERELKLTGNSFKFDNRKKKGNYEACFQSLQFKGKFSRQGTQTGKQVHEEKSRIIFTTNIHGQNIWTLSLPLVVTTGANQGCLSQASVMWQCFSTDVYSVPIAECLPMPCYQLMEMLQAKMQKLCPERKLTQENINHFKRRLFGRSDVTDDELVTLKKFCFDKLEKTDEEGQALPFSFWKWFVGQYNLLDKYLLDFWKHGYIVGFISKEEAKEKLKRCKRGRSGTFLLRFSDHNITDSQGMKSVFGHLTACVLIIKEEIDGVKKKKIFDLEVAGHKKLKEKNLANILKETEEAKSGKIYQYLYPGELSREETFDGYCDKDAIVPGYTGTRDAFVVHLDQQLAALDISSGKHARSPSIDSGIDPASPCNSGLSLYGTAGNGSCKKQCVGVKHPTIAKILQQGNSSVLKARSNCSSQKEVHSELSRSPQNNPFMSSIQTTGHNPVCVASNPAYSGMSPSYPSVPSPANSTHSLSQDSQRPHVFAEMSGHESPSVLSLPTVIEEAVTVNGKTRKRNTAKVNEVPTFQMDCSEGTKQLPSDNGAGTTRMMIEESDQSMPCMSFETGCEEVIVMSHSGHSSLESSHSSQSAGSSNVQCIEIVPDPSEDVSIMSDNSVRSGEIVSSTVSDQQGNELGQILTLVSSLPPEILKQLQNYLEHTADNVMPESTPAVCASINSSDTIALTSSGSISEVFNFSSNEIAEGQEMNSGTIDPSVFLSIDNSSGGMTS